jgi:hypothetical protein
MSEIDEEEEEDVEEDSTSEGKKKEKDFGEIILTSDGKPICSEHMHSLWIAEKNLPENSALCLYSDETIYAAKGVKLTKSNLSENNIPDELDYVSAVFHDPAVK